MSYRIKIDSKNTLTDEAHLLSGIERFGMLLQQHQWKILIAFTVLLTAAAAVGVVVWFDHRNSEQAMVLDQQATRLYLDRPIEQPKKADENLKQAIALYRQTLDSYPHSPIAPLTLYRLGNALVQANDLDGAVNAYQKFVAMYGDNKRLLSLVYQRLGYAHLLKGDVEQGRKAMSTVLDLPDALNKDQALFELGKIDENQSRPEGAMAHYQDLIKTYPNSPFTGEASMRAKALEVKKSPDGTVTESSERTPTPSGKATMGTSEGGH